MIEHSIGRRLGLPKVTGEFGIEVEMEGINLPGIDAPPWITKEDGSLRGEGWEYVLLNPLPYDKAAAAVTQLYKQVLGKAVLKPSRRCGVHVHVNVQNMTMLQLMTFICLYMVVEDVLLEVAGPGRAGNIFCLRGRDAEAIYDTLARAYARNDPNIFRLHNTGRYSSVNVEAVPKYGSLEFRALQTPAQPERIIEWMNMLRCVRDASKSFDSPHNIVEQFSQREPHGFLNMVFGEAQVIELLTDHTARQLWDGVRRIQDVAYPADYLLRRPEWEDFDQLHEPDEEDPDELDLDEVMED